MKISEKVENPLKPITRYKWNSISRWRKTIV